MNLVVMSNDEIRQVLIGCGIFKKEINWLVNENNWQVDTFFLDSSLHFDFDQLYNCLSGAVIRCSSQSPVVFYGCCHPYMDNLMNELNTVRTKGQNCIEMLLGHDLFMKELSNGAYFLLEDWALSWSLIVTKTFGDNMEVTKQIFQGDRKYILGIKTPCCNDFTQEAELAAQSVGLPLYWIDVGLGYLKSVIFSAIQQKNGQYGR